MTRVRIVSDKDGKWYHLTVNGQVQVQTWPNGKPVEYGSFYDATQAANVIRNQSAKEFFSEQRNPAP